MLFRSVEAVVDYGHVDVDDVAGFQTFVVRDAVADDVVHRGADGFRIAAVIEVRGDRALHGDDVVVADAIEFLGRHPRLHVRADEVQDLGGEPAGLAHFSLFIKALDGDGHGQLKGQGATRKALFLREVHGIKQIGRAHV